MREVVAFYDEHPINEGEVLSKLQADGKQLDALQPADLLAYDQDHYGGTEASDALAQRLALAPGMRVLDVCAGMGGTSRYLAWKYGCIVVGVDFTASRVAGAQALTRRVGLHERVTIVQGDATRLALSPADFDAAVSQEAFLHIADKAALLGGCRRMLRPGGRLGFTDLLATPRLTDADRKRLAEAIAALGLIAAEEYTAHLTGAGLERNPARAAGDVPLPGRRDREALRSRAPRALHCRLHALRGVHRGRPAGRGPLPGRDVMRQPL
jgi:ubiquinone/menaquinone biosynthesis C-methylase UbiE